MIRARRQLHLSLFMMMLPIVPALLALVLLGRPEVPPTSSALDPTLAASASFAGASTEPVQLIATGKHRLLLQRHSADDANGTMLTIQPTTQILHPDVLIYWSPETAAARQPGQDAILVGSLSGVSRRLLQLPATSVGQTNGLHGSLVLFSLAHNQVIDQFPLSELQRATQVSNSIARE